MDKKLLSEVSRIKEMMGIINEQVVTDYDSKYDYKKEGDQYFTKRKGTDKWIKATGDSERAIKNRVFKDSEVNINPEEKPSNNETKKEIPFKNREEGDKFRSWVNDNYPEYAKSIDLDRSGSFNNSYIKRAWDKYGEEYQKKSSDDEGVLINFLRKYFPSIAQLIYSKNLTNSDFQEEHFDVLKDVVKNAKKRIPNFQYNKTYGTEYIDYDSKTESVLDTRGQSIWDLIKLYIHDSDMFDVSTTLGRFSFQVDENGNITIYDEYDFTGQYDISKEDLDWNNTNVIQKIMKIMELGKGEIGLYGAVRHLAHLYNPQGGTNQGLTVNLNIEDPELRQLS